MRVTICGPNLNDQTRGQFHVHAEGCADLARGANRESAYRDGWTIDAADRTAVCDETYPPDQFECESGDYLDEFHFFPCCSSLPTGGPVR